MATWVNPALQNSIVIGSQIMSDLGFANVEDTPAEEVQPDEGDTVDAFSLEVVINNPDRYAGEDATEDIPTSFITSFHLEVVYRQVKPHRRETYHPMPPHDPEEVSLQYFQDNPHNHLSDLSFDLWRKLLGASNLGTSDQNHGVFLNRLTTKWRTIMQTFMERAWIFIRSSPRTRRQRRSRRVNTQLGTQYGRPGALLPPSRVLKTSQGPSPSSELGNF